LQETAPTLIVVAENLTNYTTENEETRTESEIIAHTLEVHLNQDQEAVVEKEVGGVVVIEVGEKPADETKDDAHALTVGEEVVQIVEISTVEDHHVVEKGETEEMIEGVVQEVRDESEDVVILAVRTEGEVDLTEIKLLMILYVTTAKKKAIMLTIVKKRKKNQFAIIVRDLVIWPIIAQIRENKERLYAIIVTRRATWQGTALKKEE